MPSTMAHKLRHGGGRAFRAAEEAERRGEPLDLTEAAGDVGTFVPPSPAPATEPAPEAPSDHSKPRRWLRSKGGVQS